MNTANVLPQFIPPRPRTSSSPTASRSAGVGAGLAVLADDDRLQDLQKIVIGKTNPRKHFDTNSSPASSSRSGPSRSAPGIWCLSPSLNVPGLVHAFVVLYGVPDPAPFDKRILVVTNNIAVPA